MLLIGLPLILLLGGVAVGLSVIGIVHIPFLPFGKKPAKVPPDDGKGGPFAPYLAMAASVDRRFATETPVKKETKPKVDTGPGEAKLADLWSTLPPDRLAALVAKWPDAQLGRILALMDDEPVSALLASLPPTRAAALSQLIATATDESAGKVRT